MSTILIVDDERDMRHLLEMVLQRAGFQTMTAKDGLAALAQLHNDTVDLLLLDIMMPGMDGFELCEKIRQTSSVPIIFLSAKGTNEDKVKGLMMGADDYIVKPFTASEVVARIVAVLRRSEAHDGGYSQQKLTYGVIQMDEVARKVFVKDHQVNLTLKEYEMLQLFMKNPNIVYSREQLLERIWDIDYAGGTRTVDTHIKTLRLKLNKQSAEACDYIQTVWGIGYRFGESL